MEEMDEDTKIRKTFRIHGRINIIKIFALLKAIYNFNTIPKTMPMTCFQN